MAKAARKNIKKTETQENPIMTSGFFKPVVEKCEGCERIVQADSEKFCRTYAIPEAKWRLGICNFATHVKPEVLTAKVKINPLKASKRAMAKKK